MLFLFTPKSFLFFFFFFQAEDGIRDTSVTGVQTCALPILQVWASDFLPAEHQGTWVVPGAEPIANMKRSEERRVGKSVDLGGRRIIKKKKRNSITRIEKSSGRILT